MCWPIQVYSGPDIIKVCNTTEDAIRYFGIDKIRFYEGSLPDPNEKHDYCCCPIDLDYLCASDGLAMVGDKDTRWDPLCTALEIRANDPVSEC
jgi:hypothetical protein